MILTDAIKLIRNGYEGYPAKALMFGWLVVIVVPILAIIIASIKNRGEVKEVDIHHPSKPFVSDVGYVRLLRYFKAVLLGGLLLITIIILSKFITSLAVLVIPLITLFIFLALVGGAIYFTRISMKEGHRRDGWAEQALDEK